MNKTININLAGIIFYVDEEAYSHFNNYLQAIRKQFNNAEEQAEIIADIEARIAELLQEKLSDSKQVIGKNDIDEVIAIMGSPEDYAVDDETETGSSYAHSESAKSEFRGPKKLYRNPDDKILGGVSGGLAAYFGIDTIWIRLIWVALFFGWGTGVFIYIILWIVMPEAKTTAQKLQMRGEPITIDNIERTVKEEMRNVKVKLDSLTENGKVKSGVNRVGNVLEDIVMALLSIARFVLKFALKFIGGFLMFFGVIVLIVVFSLLLGNDISIGGALVDWAVATDYLSALMPSSTSANIMLTGVILVALAPVFGLTLLGMRILFNYKPQFKYTSSILTVVSIVGVVMMFFAGATLGNNFNSEAKYNKIIEFGGVHKNYAVRVTEFLNDERPIDLNWTITPKAQLLGSVGLDIEKTNEGAPYVELVMESRGKSRMEARKRAENYNFFVAQQDSIINLADYFTIPVDEKFRKQELNVVLYLPVGTSVFLDQSTIDILNDVGNITSTWDADMVEHTWIMTQNGLACTDCKGGGESEFKDQKEWDSYEDQFSDEAEAFDEEAQLRKAERELEAAQKEVERLKKQQK